MKKKVLLAIGVVAMLFVVTACKKDHCTSDKPYYCAGYNYCCPYPYLATGQGMCYQYKSDCQAAGYYCVKCERE